MAENTIDNLSIQVTASADKAASVFDRLASSAGRLRGAASGAAGGMQDMAQGARDAGTATATAGEQAGQAQPRIRGVGNAAKDAGDNAKKGASGLATFWQSLKRIAFYRFIRSVIKEITSAFSEGIKNLYHWSDLINGHFAASMDRLATSSQYLKNSLAAMVSPLIETLVPVLDVIIDKIVDVLNFFNMLVSAISGADTYTVAKKAAAVWDDSASKTKKAAKSAASELKRTILGFDEINKLVKQSNPSSGSGSSSGKKQPDYGAMFEEKPLTGIFKKISDVTSGWPDWLKALLGVGTAGLAIFGIPALLKAIFDGLKKLFTIKIPDWFRWLFGPKGNGDGGIDIPKEIDLPDGNIKVKLDTDDLEEIKIPISPMKTGDDLFKDLRTDWNKNKTTLFVNDKLLDSGDELFKALRTEWNKNKTTLFVSVMLLKTGFDLFKELRSLWNKDKTTLLADVRLLKTGGELFKGLRTDWNKVKTTLLVDAKLIKTGSELFKEIRAEWNKVKTTLFVPDKLLDSGEELFKEFRTSWNRTKTTMFVDVKLLKTGEELFKELRTSWNTTKTTLFVEVGLIKKDWTTVHDYVDDNFGNQTTNVGFDGAFSGGGNARGGGAGRGRHSTLRSYDISVDLSPGWSGTPQSALGLEGLSASATVNATPGTNMGYGSSWWGGGGLTPNVSNTDASATINAIAGSNMSGGNWWSGGSLYPVVGDTTSTAYVDVSTPWSWWEGIRGYLGLNNLDATAWVDVDTPWWYWGRSLLSWLGMDNLSTTVTVNAVAGSGGGGGGAVNLMATKAKGGIFSRGTWSDIPQYASGRAGVNHGSLFWAGENGAEIVGNAGGRTEVLNRSQIASAMYSAVQAAMAPAAANFASAAESMGSVSIGFDIETLAEMVRQGVEQAMSRSNDYDRQKVDLLRQINDKDFTAEVTSDSINNAQRRMNRRAGTTVVAVG